MKQQPRYVRKDRKGYYINIGLAEHARIVRRAAAANMSAGKYGEVAMKLVMDLEDAAGAPMTPQLRESLVRQAARAAEAYRKSLL